MNPSLKLLLALVVAFLVLAAPAVAGMRPDRAPGQHHVRIVNRPYYYDTVWTASDGSRLYVTCRVARQTLCRITRIELAP